jgi:cytochrome c biogenesis protein CcdA
MDLIFAYLAGLLTLINPCVLPVLPIVLASSLQTDRRAPLALAAGMVLSFVLFGAIGIFILINLYLLELAPDFNYVQQGFTASMWAPYPSPIRFISAVSITLVAYSY